MSATYPILRSSLEPILSALPSLRSSVADVASQQDVPALSPELLVDPIRTAWRPIHTHLTSNLPPPVPPISTELATKLENNKDGNKIAVTIPQEELDQEEERKRLEKERKEKMNPIVDQVRGWMELVGKEVVVTPITTGELDDSDEANFYPFLAAIQDRLDLVLTFYEVVYESLENDPFIEPGAIFIPLLEELVELVSVETWRKLWAYIESRQSRFTKDMPASRGKALPLLRIINAFFRFLPRTPEDLVFRGRVHQFASGVIGVADKSSVNLRGEYGGEVTEWEEEEQEQVKEDDKEQGDVEMNGEAPTATADDVKDAKEGKLDAGEAKEIKEQNAKLADPSLPTKTFYHALWSLQKYFSNPTTLEGPAVQTTLPSGTTMTETPLETFKRLTDLVLPVLFEQTNKEKAVAGADTVDGSASTRKRKRVDETSDPSSSPSVSLNSNTDPAALTGTSSSSSFFHPRYLTPRNLLPYELADLSFRRQIYVQFLVLSKYLMSFLPDPTTGDPPKQFPGGLSKEFILSQEDVEWTMSKIKAIRNELSRMGRDRAEGQRWEKSIIDLITGEVHYVDWKNDGCPSSIFEIPPYAADDARAGAFAWRRLIKPPWAWPHKVGTKALSELWQVGYAGPEDLKGYERPSTPQSLQVKIKELEDETETKRSAGELQAEDEQRIKSVQKLNWQALRQASRTHLRFFGHLKAQRRISTLTSAIKDETEKLAKAEEDRLAGRLNGSKTPLNGEAQGTITPQPATPVHDAAQVAVGADGEVAQESQQGQQVGPALTEKGEERVPTPPSSPRKTRGVDEVDGAEEREGKRSRVEEDVAMET